MSLNGRIPNYTTWNKVVKKLVYFCILFQTPPPLVAETRKAKKKPEVNFSRKIFPYCWLDAGSGFIVSNGAPMEEVFPVFSNN